MMSLKSFKNSWRYSFFSTNINLFSSLSNSSGTLTLGLNNAVGQTINVTHDKIWLLVRYTGTPSNTLERITISVS